MTAADGDRADRDAQRIPRPAHGTLENGPLRFFERHLHGAQRQFRSVSRVEGAGIGAEFHSDLEAAAKRDPERHVQFGQLAGQAAVVDPDQQLVQRAVYGNVDRSPDEIARIGEPVNDVALRAGAGDPPSALFNGDGETRLGVIRSNEPSRRGNVDIGHCPHGSLRAHPAGDDRFLEQHPDEASGRPFHSRVGIDDFEEIADDEADA